MRQLIAVSMLASLFAMPAARAQVDLSAVRVVLQDLEAATNRRDTARILRHAADEIVMVSKNGDIVKGKQGVAAYLDKMFGMAPSLKGLRSRVILSEPLIAHGQLVLAQGVSQDEYAFSDGLNLAVTTSWSATLVPVGAEWKIARIHFSFNLFDNPLLNAANRARYAVIAVCALLGMASVLVFARF